MSIEFLPYECETDSDWSATIPGKPAKIVCPTQEWALLGNQPHTRPKR
jgi:hypothetical protein